VWRVAHPRSAYTEWVPHPFAHLAKGWETTNLNSPSPFLYDYPEAFFCQKRADGPPAFERVLDSCLPLDCNADTQQSAWPHRQITSILFPIFSQ